MNAELDKKLCEDFPLLYEDRHVDMRSTAMCWGFDVDDGWEPLIRDLSLKLEKEIKRFIEDNSTMCSCHHENVIHDNNGCSYVFEKSKFNSEEFKCNCEKFKVLHPKASQVKEKYGGLRVYLTFGTETMYDLISEAEKLSYEICEHCSAPGMLMTTNLGNPRGWQSTLCLKCAETVEFFKVREYAPIKSDEDESL